MSLPEELGYSLVELADQTGLSPRTIHYYSSQGLLPPADRRGAGARYPVSTLKRLRAVQAFKSEVRLTLQEIRRLLGTLSDERVAAIASGESSPWEAIDRPGKPAAATPNAAPQAVARPTGSEAPSSAAAPASPSAPAGLVTRAATLPTGDRPPDASGAPPSGSRPSSAPPSSAPPSGAPLSGVGAPPAFASTAAPTLLQREAAVVGGEASAQLASLLRTLDSRAGRSVPRAGSRDHWLTIPITADLQISAHRVSGEDIEVLRRVADHLRALLVQGFAGTRASGAESREDRPSPPPSGADPRADRTSVHEPGRGPERDADGSPRRDPGPRVERNSGQRRDGGGEGGGRSGAGGRGDGFGAPGS